MISTFLAMAALLQPGIAPDTIRDPVAVYAPILEQALRTYPARPGLPVALSGTAGDAECTPHCTGSAAFTRRHSADVVRELQARGLIQTTCESRPGYLGCPSHPEHLFVALSPVLEFPGDSKMKPVVLTPGESVDSAIAAASDRAEVPVDARVDVVVFSPLPVSRLAGPVPSPGRRRFQVLSPGPTEWRVQCRRAPADLADVTRVEEVRHRGAQPGIGWAPCLSL